MDKNKIIIVGAGLSGSLMAIYLARKGFTVEVYEKRADMRVEDVSAGRSINLALSNRGIKALEEVGLADKVLKEAIGMRVRMMHAKDKSRTYVPYSSKTSEYINSISRETLNIELMDAAEREDNVSFFFNEKCMKIDFDKTEVIFSNAETGEEKKVQATLIIGADGANSAVRAAMKEKVSDFSESYEFLDYGYKELTIPPKEDGENKFQIEQIALHIWPRKSHMMIALPNKGGDFTCTLFLPLEGGRHSFEHMENSNLAVMTFFRDQFPDAVPMMPTLIKDYVTNPVSKLGTVSCFPWSHENNVLLLGDAAHAIVPFYGQGMNCSFEDCIVLNKAIDEHGTDWEKVFTTYVEDRKPNADAISQLAMENFVEMRDHVADPVFTRKRLLELNLEAEFEDYYSKYSMVTFHPEISYVDARRRGNKQDEILMDICHQNADINKLNLQEIYKRIQREAS